ncbi:hypothetical protein A0H81_03020 [Grifola frondosa]|uniref:Uncharacterized protein n=1 Tax=Grifola frondosa TaxID=5627 RepID=A0A1C7MHE7_GRIFR|nr:hypothetical protein A0H81_03020 [Grifola frondosa]
MKRSMRGRNNNSCLEDVARLVYDAFRLCNLFIVDIWAVSHLTSMRYITFKKYVPRAGGGTQDSPSKGTPAETAPVTSVKGHLPIPETVRPLYQLSVAEQEKRSRELDALQRTHEYRHAKLERLVLLLLGCLVALAAAMLHSILRQNHHPHPPSPSRWTIPVMHFTIPVLSPFTSVIEHETSVINTRLITALGFLLICACLGYACFRYWLGHV